MFRMFYEKKMKNYVRYFDEFPTVSVFAKQRKERSFYKK